MRAVIDDKLVDNEVEILLQSRNTVAIAIQELVDLIDNKSREISKEDQQLRIRLRRELNGTFSKTDKLAIKVTNAVNSIQERLGSEPNSRFT